MRMALMIVCSFFITTSAFTQAASAAKNSLIFSAGIGVRVTPVHLGGESTDYSLPFIVQTDSQLSGPALYAGVLYYWKKQKIGFEFSSSFRYHMLNILHSEDQEIDNSYSLISDFHFTINKFFPLRKNMLRAAIGYSFLNRGTEFDYKYEYINAPGDTVYYSGLYDLHFSTFNAGIGYQINQLSFELVNRFSFHKFSTDGYIYIPELRVTYGFRLKNEKIFQ